jgi:YfiH family protein
MPFHTHEKNHLVWMTSSVLSGITHAFSTRKGGVSVPPWDSLNLGLNLGDDPDAILENHRRFFSAAGAEVNRAVLSRQVHETTVRLCTDADAGKGLFHERDYSADALITNRPNLPLTVFSADCGIILLYDPVQKAIGAVHAGWRGCAAGILEKTVQEMSEAFGSRADDLLAAIGPCIGPCCFETDNDVADAMIAALGEETAAPCLERRGMKWHVNLGGLNRLWLLRAGLRPEHIDLCGLCTACHPEWFWSHRKMGSARGLQAAMISLPKEDRL